MNEGIGLLPNANAFDSTHQNTVCNDKTHIYGELFAYLIDIGLQYLVYQNYEQRYNDKLYDDPNSVRNRISYQRNKET